MRQSAARLVLSHGRPGDLPYRVSELQVDMPRNAVVGDLKADALIRTLQGLELGESDLEEGVARPLWRECRCAVYDLARLLDRAEGGVTLRCPSEPPVAVSFDEIRSSLEQ